MLTALVRRRLLASAYTALRGVECKVLYDVASLEGTLGSHYLKQVAQAFALAVEGIGQVENRIHVTPVRVMPGRRV
jgi:osmotically-inducible protein OsmY